MIDEDPVAVERIMRAVDELDVSIRQVRVDDLRAPSAAERPTDAAQRDRAVCDDARVALGFKPSCDIDGPVDSAVDEQVRGHLLLCLREALSNVARHAEASAVDVTISVRRGRLVLQVVDDGVGYQAHDGDRSSGVENMMVRAESLGGAFSIEGRGRRRHAADVGRATGCPVTATLYSTPPRAW